MARRLALIAVIVGFANACGGGGTEPQKNDTADAVVATVTVSAAASTISPGASTQLTAAAKNAAGATLTGLTATWTSSAQNVATVSSTGLVTGVATGSATITATISGISGSRVIGVQEITPVSAASVDASPANSFFPAQVDLTAGGTVTWNFGSVTHNVTFSSTGGGTPSNISDQTNTSVSRTFTTAGTFPYSCTLHAGMNGTVIVH